ncbi:MAG: TRAP transporter fused permease subunit, partial [Proteobacteria bacterium]|nr:TRAP transporter fused permease subunit [Pseudomonadota bacterium]
MQDAAAPRWARIAAPPLALAAVGFHLWLIGTGLVPNLVSRPIHMALALPWIFLLDVRGTFGARLLGAFFCLAGLAACAYVVLARDALDEQYGALQGSLQFVVAIVLLVVTLEMARRAIKLALPGVAVVALAYGLFGQHLPGEFGHAGMPLASLLGTLTIAEGGLWGPLTGVSVNVVAVFVMLGAFIGAGQGGIGFMALATWLAGNLRAGAAKVAIIASALFGSISGSASANVASTGAITLPAMKRLGYPSSLAAAVEAVASSGGQIMPPLMGAGAFVMVELLGLRYADIMAAALLPALLFFWCAWVGVDRYARQLGLQAMRPEDRATGREVLVSLPFFLLPFGILLGVLFFTPYTAQYAAAFAIIAAALLLFLGPRWRIERAGWTRFLQGCENAARQIAGIAAIILCAGIVIGVLNLTGLGVKTTSVIIGLSGGDLWTALLLTAIACLLLGMEVPTTAAYVICIAVAGPALQALGLPALH